MRAGWSSFFSALFHLAWVPLGGLVSGYKASIDTALTLLVNSDNSALSLAVKRAAANPSCVFVYFATIYLFSAVVGWGLQKLVLRYDLDKRFSLLRFRNEWYYLFQRNDAAFTYVSVTCEHAGDVYLFYGRLDEYFLSNDNSLRELHLTDVYRRKLRDDRIDGASHSPGSPDDRYYGLKRAVLSSITVAFER